jgi:hypothetical protein
MKVYTLKEAEPKLPCEHTRNQKVVNIFLLLIA